MSGVVILENITEAESDQLQNAAASSVTKFAHLDTGWNASSRTTLQDALANKDLPNRTNLPPHFYIELWADQTGWDNWQTDLDACTFLGRCVRPTGAKLGMAEWVGDAAKAAWAANDAIGAIKAQILNQTSVSIEIYKIGGVEVDNDNFPESAMADWSFYAS